MKTLLAFLSCALLFAASPAAAEPAPDNDPLAPFDVLIGDWTVVNSQNTATGWEEIARTRTTFRRILNGKMIEEVGVYSTGEAFDVRHYFSRDVFRDVYRATLMDGTHGLLDVYEGDFDEAGVFVMDNVRAGTFFPAADGGAMAVRFRYALEAENPHVVIDVSMDEGAVWTPFLRADFEPAELG